MDVLIGSLAMAAGQVVVVAQQALRGPIVITSGRRPGRLPAVDSERHASGQT